MQHRRLSDHEYIEGIRNNTSKVIDLFYEEYSPSIVKFVRSRNGTKSDAKDVIQEGMKRLYVKSKSKDFAIRGSLKNYFFAICKNAWLRSLEIRDRERNIDMTDWSSEQITEFNELLEEKRLILYYESIRLLRPICQQLIKLRRENMAFKDISAKLNISNALNTRQKHDYCLKNLIQIIESHKDYKYLKYE